MKQITQDAIEAFDMGVAFHRSNTQVTVVGDTVFLMLFGNAIAYRSPTGFYVSHAGFTTNTTKERLNGFNGVSIKQRKGVWYLNEEVMANSWTTIDEEELPL